MRLIVPAIAAHLIAVECVAHCSQKLTSYRLSHEVLQVHERGVELAGEPWALLAHLVTPDVAWIAPWRFSASAIVLPKTIFQEGLSEGDSRYFVVLVAADAYGRLKQSAGVDHAEQCNLLSPDLHHRIIERIDVFLAFKKRLLFGQSVSHSSGR